MKKWTVRAGQVSLAAAAIVAVGAGIASADTGTTSGNGSVLGGNQIDAPISVPINVSGDAISAGGYAAAASKGRATVTNDDGYGGGMTTSGNYSIAGGNQVYLPISAPIDVCGDAATLLGDAKAACKGGASVHNHGLGLGHHMTTSGNYSIAGGNQVTAPVSVPIDVCGDAISAAGVAKAECEGVAKVVNGHRHHYHHYIVSGRVARYAQSGRKQAPPVPSLPSLVKLPGTANGPVSVLPGVGGTSNPLAQTQLPLLNQFNGPASVGSPLQSLFAK